MHILEERLPLDGGDSRSVGVSAVVWLAQEGQGDHQGVFCS